jgi:uncharacterized damage-inducible protein DinB
MDNSTTLGAQFLNELEAEAGASRKCVERIPESLFSWKPHEKSMAMGYLALIVAEIPKWITTMAEGNDIDFTTFPHIQPKTTADLVNHFDENMVAARKVLPKVTDESLAGMFDLKNNGQVLFSSPRKDNISSSIRHLVHHRGQLTVYMRLNNIEVPSIYGPSADERLF